jgi:hypothetical protein
MIALQYDLITSQRTLTIIKISGLKPRPNERIMLQNSSEHKFVQWARLEGDRYRIDYPIAPKRDKLKLFPPEEL